MTNRLLVALALLLTTALAFAEVAPPGGHVAWTRAALARVPVAKADRTPERAAVHSANLDIFAAEIARVSERAPLPARQWASLISAVGSIESNFDTDIVAGRCRPFQCDSLVVKGERIFRAVGAFQQRDVSFVHDLWPTAAGDIAAQVAMADRTLRRSLTRCAPFAPFPAHVFRAYGGSSSCSWPAPREALRVSTYLRLMATPKPGAGT